MACSYNGDKIYNLEPHKHEDWKWFSWKEIVEFNENNGKQKKSSARKLRFVSNCVRIHSLPIFNNDLI